jgi:hypothetical protein
MKLAEKEIAEINARWQREAYDVGADEAQVLDLAWDIGLFGVACGSPWCRGVHTFRVGVALTRMEGDAFPIPVISLQEDDRLLTATLDKNSLAEFARDCREALDALP